MSVAHVKAPVPLLPGGPEYALSSKPMVTSCGTCAGVSPHGGFADGATLSFPVHGPRPSSQTPGTPPPSDDEEPLPPPSRVLLSSSPPLLSAACPRLQAAST